MDDGQTILLFSCLIAPLARTNPSSVLESSLKMSASSVSTQTSFTQTDFKKQAVSVCGNLLQLRLFVSLTEKDPKYTLQYSQLRRTCGQVWHTIRSLKEDWQRLQQGQKAAM